MVVERAIDPDTWSTAGFGEEPPNHFLDIDWEGYGKYPFDGAAARLRRRRVAKFGEDRVMQEGTLPWRTEEMYGNLRRAFEALRARRHLRRRCDIAASVSAGWRTTSPMRTCRCTASSNYDGQLTGQNGVHARWESDDVRALSRRG